MNQSRCQNDYLFCYVRVPTCFVKIQLWFPPEFFAKFYVGLLTAMNNAIASNLMALELAAKWFFLKVLPVHELQDNQPKWYYNKSNKRARKWTKMMSEVLHSIFSCFGLSCLIFMFVWSPKIKAIYSSFKLLLISFSTFWDRGPGISIFTFRSIQTL